MLLAIDIGSSSVKAAMLEGVAAFKTDHAADRAEVPVERIDHAIRQAVGRLDLSQASAVALTGMGPAWLAMDERGEALTNAITHQDRRSLQQARRIESVVGRERHLHLAGNRPTPGGISSTTAAWFAEQTDVIDRAAMLGHLPTYLLHKLTGVWTIDPSNAGFTGLMDISTLDWCEELCAAAGVPMDKLPPIASWQRLPAAESDSGSAAGSRCYATRHNPLNIPPGLPIFGGLLDGSCPVLLAGARPGTLIRSVGSTDVLALCTDRPMPRDGLLCRPLGAKNLWLSVATLSSAGSTLAWARRMLFASTTDTGFHDLCRKALERPETNVRFDPRLAGDRQGVEQPTGGWLGLTLSAERLDLLRAVLVSLRESAEERFDRLRALGLPMSDTLHLTGGASGLANLDPPHLPGIRRIVPLEDATLRGLRNL